VSQFVDESQLNIRGGDGGAGCVSFRREGPVVYGGPNGGDGGDGGDVWLVADHNVASLLAFRDHPHRRAGNGVHGKGKDLHGRRGQSLEIKVPEGTVVKDLYSGEVLLNCTDTAIGGLVLQAVVVVEVMPGSCRISVVRRVSLNRVSMAKSAGSNSRCNSWRTSRSSVSPTRVRAP
jgi:GTPase involved in cell partitioning and DNA repair